MAETMWSKVLCLEGLWHEHEFDDRSSVLPSLEMLERLGVLDSFVYHDVATRDELRFHLQRWCEMENDFFTLYLAFHGSAGTLHLSRAESVALDELEAELSGQLDKCVVYLGSCSVMNDKAMVKRFIKATGAAAVIGYTTDVDWVESAAMDLMVLEKLSRYAKLGTALNALEKHEPSRSLRRSLGLVIARR